MTVENINPEEMEEEIEDKEDENMDESGSAVTTIGGTQNITVATYNIATGREVNFDYSKSRNYEFFSNAPDAFNDAREYANTYFNIKNYGRGISRPFFMVKKKPQNEVSFLLLYCSVLTVNANHFNNLL